MVNSTPGSAPAAADPVPAAEFAGLMARLGPWDAGRRVAVAVSGGADSLCLALLSHGWGNATALIVDHGLRPAAAGEAEWTAAILRARFMPARIIRLRGLHRGSGLAARARDARYAALTAACQQAGLVDLLLGHHAGDQAETVLMRQRRGSGPAGLAGMAAVAEHGAIRLLRPMLGVAPARLRATLRALAQEWVEDPSNADPRAMRTRVRAELAADPRVAITPAAGRAEADDAIAAELAARASIYPEGVAILSPGPVSPAALGALLRGIGGDPYPPPSAAVASLAAALRPSTLAGVRILPAGRLGPGWLLAREEAAVAPRAALADGVVWDGRFRVSMQRGGGPALTIGPLGDDAAALRHLSNWPAAVLRTLPAIRHNKLLSAVPHLAYAVLSADLGEVRVHSVAAPVCAAAFAGF